MKPTISILHATRGRPKKAIKAMRMFHENAQYMECLEYVLSMDLDDPEIIKDSSMADHAVYFCFSTPSGSVNAWNHAAKISHGDLLIQGQDDIEPPVGWDKILINRIQTQAGKDWRDKPLVVAVSDGYRKDKLMCTAICNRARCDQQGYFLHPDYYSVFSDDDFTINAIADAQDGKCILIDARDIVFRHRHYCHDKSVPFDETYARENDQSAYALGAKVFNERNRPLINRGLKDWS